jgi:hypothetical protein
MREREMCLKLPLLKAQSVFGKLQTRQQYQLSNFLDVTFLLKIVLFLEYTNQILGTLKRNAKALEFGYLGK